MIVYGVPLSPFVRKVLFVLGELRLDAERVDTPPASDEVVFRRISPLGRIPAFSDAQFEIADSAAINRYLVMREHSPLMGGNNATRQARITAWETFADDDLAPALQVALIERVVKPVRLGEQTNEKAVTASLVDSLEPVYRHLEQRLANVNCWVLGATASMPTSLSVHLATAELADVLPQAQRYPKLNTWPKSVRTGYRC